LREAALNETLGRGASSLDIVVGFREEVALRLAIAETDPAPLALGVLNFKGLPGVNDTEPARVNSVEREAGKGPVGSGAGVNDGLAHGGKGQGVERCGADLLSLWGISYAPPVLMEAYSLDSLAESTGRAEA
jgi:hypothetical protein